jgi:hypothetical protein
MSGPKPKAKQKSTQASLGKTPSGAFPIHEVRSEMPKTERPVIRERDSSGRAIVRVPLGPDCGRHATLFAADYERLLAAGVRQPWFIVRNGTGGEHVRAYCRGASGDQITVARALLGLTRGRIVRYSSPDHLDLRPWNLSVAKGYGKRSDRNIPTDATRAVTDLNVPEAGEAQHVHELHG